MQVEVKARKREVRYAGRQRMASNSPRWQQTGRDREILAALDLCPMESRDLLEMSRTFSQPFGSLDRVRRTLKRLEAARQVRSWRYATTGEGGGAAPLYYKLTLEGYRTLHQSEIAIPPTKRYLSAISVGRHQHQRSLTAYVVKTHVAAHRRGIRIADSFAENTFRIDTPFGPLFPDRRFTIVLPNGRQFLNCIELDNSTETVVSKSEIDSIEMKMRKYLHDLNERAYDYRVQFVVTRSRDRANHILELAARLRPQTDFAPFYVVYLDDYLSTTDSFLAPIFASPRNPRIPLLRAQVETLHSVQRPSS